MWTIASDIRMKQAEGVPRGLLRFLVLKFLAEKPMSGAEIVGKIEHETGGKWKPSPGSIYPLLARLQAKGFTQETSSIESARKLYYLTDTGKKFFQEQSMLGQKFMEKMEYLIPLFIEGYPLGKNEENLFSAKESAKRFLQTFIELDSKKETLTNADVSEIARILDNSNVQLKAIIEKINGGNQ
jgi:DNA-binding PadR family transcriptional regulator